MAFINIDFKARAERERQAAELERQKLAREKVAGLMGQAQAPYQMGEEELFPGEIQEEAISSGMPIGTPAGQAPAGLMTAGTGYLGSLSDPREIARAKLHGGLMGTEGYEAIGAQGLMGLEADQTALLKQALIERAKGSGKSFEKEKDLRKSFEGQTKDFTKVRDAYRRIEAAAAKPTAAGDMALIFNFMKVLDPGSTVREGEFATAQNTTGAGSRIINLYNNVMTGQRLNPTQRTDFVGQANNLYTAQLGGLKQLEDQYTGLATSYGLNPKNVIVDYRVKPKKKSISDMSDAELQAIAGAR